jgi:uncharacterized protein YndB with AHSA1/START domain
MDQPAGNRDLSRPLDEVRVERDLKASAARIWALWTSDAGMRRWMGFDLFQPRVRGRHLRDANAAGPEDRIIIWGRITELQEQSHIAMTWRVLRENGTVWPADTLLRLELEERGGLCTVRLIHSGFAALGDTAEGNYKVYHHCWVQTNYLQQLGEQAATDG